jgi:hypothetical protein
MSSIDYVILAVDLAAVFCVGLYFVKIGGLFVEITICKRFRICLAFPPVDNIGSDIWQKGYVRKRQTLRTLVVV